MAASIEARTFMDVKAAEFASTPMVGALGSRHQGIVREAMAPRLPKAVLTRQKNGFRMPVTEWFCGPLREPARALLLGQDSISGTYLNRATVGRLLDEHAQRSANHDKTLWSLFALETFLREFF